MDSIFGRPGALDVDFKGVSMWYSSHGPASDSVGIQTYSFILQEAFFLCTAGRDLVFCVCICSSATEGTLNGVTDKRICFWGRQTYTTYRVTRCMRTRLVACDFRSLALR